MNLFQVAPPRTLFVVKTTIEMEFTELFRIPSSNIYLLSGQVAQPTATPPVLLEKWVMSKVICERISTCTGLQPLQVLPQNILECVPPLIAPGHLDMPTFI